jgi:putative long chain acyl-CoA synthase
VQERFKPARVLEFYASTEGGAILVNVSGSKTGAMGRPLPGSSEVKIAAYDVVERGFVLGRDGFAVECAPDEIGMLLARVGRSEPTSTIALRGLFAPEDAWLLTGDLFRRDADGDFWRVDSAGDVILSAGGPVYPGPIRDALGDLPAVDLAVAYGVRPEGAKHETAMAAVTLRAGCELQARDIGRALSACPPEGRPAIVGVVERIPVTTWFRPLTGPLREAGIPQPGQAWYRDASGENYRPLTAAARKRLAAAAAT